MADQLREACENQPATRMAKSFSLGADSDGGKGCLLKVRLINDIDETTFIPAAGVVAMPDLIRQLLAEQGISDRRNETTFTGSIPTIQPHEWRIDTQDGKTVSVHTNVLCGLDGMWMINTIYKGEPRFIFFDRNIVWDLADELEKAAPMMVVPTPKHPTSDSRH